MANPDTPRTCFLTGYPGFIGKRLAHRILASEPETILYLLTQEKFARDARATIATLPNDQASRVRLLLGDVVHMDLGLSGPECKRLLERVTDVYHLAALQLLGVDHDTMWRVNVEGTANLLDFALEMQHLNRFNHFSSCFVAGDRRGVILEEELEAGQRFRNAYEETKYEAERLVRGRFDDLPISIYRPPIVVGESTTGEIDRFDGFYYIAFMLVASPLTVPLPLPGAGVAPLNLVPVDFLVEAVHRISLDPRGVGRTFHVVDPNPLSSRHIYELIAQRANRTLPTIQFSGRLASALMKLPGIERITRVQRHAIELVNHLAIYNNPATLELLDGTGVRCPPFSSYVDNLTRYVRDYFDEKRRAKEDAEVVDPLA